MGRGGEWRSEGGKGEVIWGKGVRCVLPRENNISRNASSFLNTIDIVYKCLPSRPGYTSIST